MNVNLTAEVSKTTLNFVEFQTPYFGVGKMTPSVTPLTVTNLW